MADGEAVFLYSKRCLFRNLRLQSANNKCVSDLSEVIICIARKNRKNSSALDVLEDIG